MGRRNVDKMENMTKTSNLIGERIYEHRVSLDMTQDQFGKRYGITGPAIFKFERGFVNPSFNLWLTMAKDFKIPEKKAVLIWVKARLPQKYQNLIDIKSASIAEEPIPHGSASESIDYSKNKNQNELRNAALKDENLPKGLKAVIKEDDIWNLFKPSGAELNFLRDTFGKLGEGSKSAYREALRLLRDFAGSE